MLVLNCFLQEAADSNKNKIEGTPILKLAMVKRFKVKIFFRKIKIQKKKRDFESGAKTKGRI